MTTNQDEIYLYGRPLSKGRIKCDGVKYQWQAKQTFPKVDMIAHPFKVVGYHICRVKKCLVKNCMVPSTYMVEVTGTGEKFDLCQYCLEYLERRLNKKITWGGGLFQ